MIKFIIGYIDIFYLRLKHFNLREDKLKTRLGTILWEINQFKMVLSETTGPILMKV